MAREPDFDLLGEELIELCFQIPPDFEAIKALLAVTDVNQKCRYDPEESMLSRIILAYHSYGMETTCRKCEHWNVGCDTCPDDRRTGTSYLPDIIQLFLDHGFDSYNGGSICLSVLYHSLIGDRMLEAAKTILRHGVDTSSNAWAEAFESVAIEESYTRVNGDHDDEHAMYALYEIMLGYKNGTEYEGIHMSNAYEYENGKKIQ